MGYLHHKTPKKSRVHGAYNFALYQSRHYGVPFYNNDIFRANAVGKTQGYSIIKDHGRTFHNNPFTDETRGRKKLLSDEDVDKIEEVLWKSGIDGRSLSYQGLLLEANIDKIISTRTIMRALGQRDWRRCVACTRGFVNEKLAARRVEEAKKSLSYRPNPEDWGDIYFSDEFHVSSDATGRVWILRKPGERYCPDCIVERPEKDPEKHTAHFWGAIGYNFKSELIEYKIPSNTNGKMTQRYYRDHILEGVVKPWLDEGRDFILEEDGDSGHGPRGDNIVKQWKEKHGLGHYFNCPGSPDWSPIEKCWRAPKGWVKDTMCVEQRDLVEACRQGWFALEQETINSYIDKIPEILRQTIEMGGKMTGN